ncbi:MAG: hypothetical protein HY910_06075 [Desulfarculus sp.]|nr:hypothetical protein [Desulfarculus sp.]
MIVSQIKYGRRATALTTSPALGQSVLGHINMFNIKQLPAQFIRPGQGGLGYATTTTGTAARAMSRGVASV